MSGKKNVGNSNLPSDSMTETLGSNYGLDGFEDLSYGAGVLEGILDPQFTEAPALPTGVHTSSAEGMDLTAMHDESLVNLDWLDPTQLQDPERLPKNPVNLSIKELEEAWSSTKPRVEGALPFVDLDGARYAASLEKSSTDNRVASRSQLAKVVSLAMRRSTAHQDIDLVCKEALESVGEEMGRIASAIRTIKSEHGLVGNVYVRASAFPGYHSGKWTPFIKRHASKSRYLIVSEAERTGSTWIVNGKCAFTGMHAVTEVPWDKALKHYSSFLKLGGRKLSSEGHPREILRTAFLSLPEKVAVDSHLPTHHIPMSDKSSSEILAEVSSTAFTQVVEDPQERRVARGVERINDAIKSGKSGQILASLIQSTFLPSDMRLAVRKLSASLKGGVLSAAPRAEKSYDGTKFEAHVGERVASRNTRTAVVSAVKWLKVALTEGFAGKELDGLLRHKFSDSLLGEVREEFSNLRKAHEGGSGFLYVDASAYDKGAGVQGCEEGGLKHRTNQIPTVLAMDKCDSCVLAVTLEDGSRRCSTYNKKLLVDANGPEMDKLRRRNIKASNQNDYEKTAALFSEPENIYNPTEFGLDNSVLEDFEFDEVVREPDFDISFGGWDLK